MNEPPFGLVLPNDLSSPHAEEAVMQYARRLGDWAHLSRFPRSMRSVAEKLEHRVAPVPLPSGVRGLRLASPKPIILTSESETHAAQERTVAHEIFHSFIGVSHNQYETNHGKVTPRQSRVEALCEIGAAELHVPLSEVERLLNGHAKIDDVPRLAAYFGASLAATLRSIVAAATTPIVGIVFEYRNKPRDRVISTTGQRVLFGAPEDYDSPKRLRIHDWSVAGGVTVRFNAHKHVEEGTSLFKAFSSQEATQGCDDLTSIGLSGGPYRTESWPYKYQGTVRVLTLVWLDSARKTSPSRVTAHSKGRLLG